MSVVLEFSSLILETRPTDELNVDLGDMVMNFFVFFSSILL